MWRFCCGWTKTGTKLPHLEVGDGVRCGKPGGAGVLLGAEGPVEGAGDGAQVEGADRRRCNTVALQRDGDGETLTMGRGGRTHRAKTGTFIAAARVAVR